MPFLSVSKSFAPSQDHFNSSRQFVEVMLQLILDCTHEGFSGEGRGGAGDGFSACAERGGFTVVPGSIRDGFFPWNSSDSLRCLQRLIGSVGNDFLQ